MPIYSEGRLLPAASRADRNVANASKGHCTAFTILGEHSGTRTQAESHLELCHLKLQNARPDVVDIREQVRFVYGRNNDRSHIFDMVVVKECGNRVAYTVKPLGRLASGRFIDEMQVISWWVEHKGFASTVRLLTDADIDMSELHNANCNIVLRDQDPIAERAARHAVSKVCGTISLRDLTQEVGLGARGYRALRRLIAKQEIRPTACGPITHVTQVERIGGLL